MQVPTWVTFILVLGLLKGCGTQSPAARSADEIAAAGADIGQKVNVDGGEEISLSEVPANVIQAALAAVSGLILERAKRKTLPGGIVHELEGTASNAEVRVTVRANGSVLQIVFDNYDDGMD